MAETRSKKRKIDTSATNMSCDYDSILSHLHAENKCIKQLKESVSKLDSVNNGFCLLKIKNCNANDAVSFSKAFCSVSRNVDNPETRLTYQYDILFQYGFTVILSFIENPTHVPTRRGEKIALVRLLQFLKNDFAECGKALRLDLEEQGKLTETEWSVKLAHHLLSKLAVNQSYILDKCSSGKGGKLKCPCCLEKISGVYGDTSIGSLSGWHGFLDILLGKDSIPVKVVFDEPMSPLGNESSLEIKIGNDLQSFRDQILSETIVFSFLQKKTNPDLDNFLIPTIGITKEDVLVYFYDCENDILLESSPLPLFRHDELSLGTILALWLTLNYKYFCSGTPSDMIEDGYTADFLKEEKVAIKVYKEDVKHNCGVSKAKVEYFKPDTYNFMGYRNRKLSVLNIQEEK